MCVREGVTGGTTTQSCRCWHNGQRGQWGGRRKDGARTARYDPPITRGSYSASEEPPFAQPVGGWTCTFPNHSCRPKKQSFLLWCILFFYYVIVHSWTQMGRNPLWLSGCTYLFLQCVFSSSILELLPCTRSHPCDWGAGWVVAIADRAWFTA